jgi:phosphatidate phosphatase LPIN
MTGINNGDSSRRSASPDLSSSYAESDEDGDENELNIDDKPGTIRPRRRSMTSMPGTLDEMHFDMDEEEEDQGHIDQYDDENYDEDENRAQEEVEEEFDDDLLVAGAMQKVPFLYE